MKVGPPTSAVSTPIGMRPAPRSITRISASAATISAAPRIADPIITVRFAVMHLALLGIALGLWMGLDPVLCGVVLAAVASGALAPLAGRPGGLSGPMGFLMTIAIASALLVLSITGVNASGAFELLWGSVLAAVVFSTWMAVALPLTLIRPG